ncbi:hypothetical protein EGW08_017364, partial [Elysia chlorotica]
DYASLFAGQVVQEAVCVLRQDPDFQDFAGARDPQDRDLSIFAENLSDQIMRDVFLSASLVSQGDRENPVGEEKKAAGPGDFGSVGHQSWTGDSGKRFPNTGGGGEEGGGEESHSRYYGQGARPKVKTVRKGEEWGGRKLHGQSPAKDIPERKLVRRSNRAAAVSGAQVPGFDPSRAKQHGRSLASSRSKHTSSLSTPPSSSIPSCHKRLSPSLLSPGRCAGSSLNVPPSVQLGSTQTGQLGKPEKTRRSHLHSKDLKQKPRRSCSGELASDSSSDGSSSSYNSDNTSSSMLPSSSDEEEQDIGPQGLLCQEEMARARRLSRRQRQNRDAIATWLAETKRENPQEFPHHNITVATSERAEVLFPAAVGDLSPCGASIESGEHLLPVGVESTEVVSPGGVMVESLGVLSPRGVEVESQSAGGLFSGGVIGEIRDLSPGGFIASSETESRIKTQAALRAEEEKKEKGKEEGEGVGSSGRLLRGETVDDVAGPVFPGQGEWSAMGLTPEMEEFATNLTQAVMTEAMDSCRGESFLRFLSYDQPIATGNWGCGSYRGNTQLKFVLQWLAASVARCPNLIYYTFGECSLSQATDVVTVLSSQTVGELVKLLRAYCCIVCNHLAETSPPPPPSSSVPTSSSASVASATPALPAEAAAAPSSSPASSSSLLSSREETAARAPVKSLASPSTLSPPSSSAACSALSSPSLQPLAHATATSTTTDNTSQQQQQQQQQCTDSQGGLPAHTSNPRLRSGQGSGSRSVAPEQQEQQLPISLFDFLLQQTQTG